MDGPAPSDGHGGSPRPPSGPLSEPREPETPSQTIQASTPAFVSQLSVVVPDSHFDSNTKLGECLRGVSGP